MGKKHDSMIVLHSTDPSTAFLKVVYEWDRDAKVFTSHRQHDEYIEAIRNAPMDEMIVFLGHGTSIGLLDTSESIGDYMIDDNDAWVLKGRQNVIGIWCIRLCQIQQATGLLYRNVHLGDEGGTYVLGEGD